jgi:MFS family permease
MGQALLTLTVAMMLSSMVGGRLTEIVGARAQTFVGSLVALAGLWWFADFGSVHVPLDVMPGMVLIGAGVGMTSPPAQAASMSTVGPGQSGMAGGVVSTMRYIGGIAGTTALGVLLRDSSSPASHQRPLFVYAGALVVAAALSILLPGRQRGRYSDRSNDMTPARPARTAGIDTASNATNPTSSGTRTNVIGSRAFTWKRKLPITRPSARDDVSPIASPIAIRRTLCKTTSLCRSCAFAPSAARMPNSR